MEDLADTGRTLALYATAVSRGWIEDSEHARLMFVAAAVHAIRVGDRNPPGLFRSTVTKQRWLFIAEGDVDEAAARLKAFDYAPIAIESTPAKPRPAELGEDAKRAAAALEWVSRERIEGDPFDSCSRWLKGWTRDRWETALRELADHRERRLRR